MERLLVNRKLREVLRQTQWLLEQIERSPLMLVELRDQAKMGAESIGSYFYLDDPDVEDAFSIWRRIYDCASHGTVIDISDIMALNIQMAELERLFNFVEQAKQATPIMGPAVPRRTWNDVPSNA